jgi:hypothetical protein
VARIFGETQDKWAKLSLYQCFEQIVVLLLSILISIVIVVAVFNVLQTILGPLRLGLLDRLGRKCFNPFSA